MDPKKKKAREIAKAAALLGLTVPQSGGPSQSDVRHERSRNAEAVLELVSNPTRFSVRRCKRCKDEFAADRANVNYCSDTCRGRAQEAIGITWDWSKPPESRWYFRYEGDRLTREPLIVPASALRALRALLLSREGDDTETIEESVNFRDDVNNDGSRSGSDEFSLDSIDDLLAGLN